MGQITQQDLIDAAKSIGLEVAYSREWHEEPTPRLEKGHGKIWNPLPSFNDLAMLIGGLGIIIDWETRHILVCTRTCALLPFAYPDGKTFKKCSPQERIQALAEACVFLAAKVQREKGE